MTFCSYHRTPRDPEDGCPDCVRERVKTFEADLPGATGGPLLDHIAQMASLGYHLRLELCKVSLVYDLPVNSVVDCFASGCLIEGPHTH